LYGATFFVVAADSELAAKLVAGTEVEKEFNAIIEEEDDTNGFTDAADADDIFG